VLLSLSRAGTMLFLLCFPLYWWLGRPSQRQRALSVVVGLGLLVLAGLLTVALDTGQVTARWQTLAALFTQPEALDRYRWQLWRDTLPMIRDHLWLGSGLETYGLLSDSYRSFYASDQWLQAHNDYLQWLAETGLVGAGLAVWFLLTLGWSSARSLAQTAQRRHRQFVVAALVGALLVLLHSLVEFPLRIPANALLFVTLLAIITAPVTHEQEEEGGAELDRLGGHRHRSYNPRRGSPTR